MEKKYYFTFKDNLFEFESAVECAEFFKDLKFEFESEYEKHIDEWWGNVEVLGYTFPSSKILKTFLDSEKWKALVKSYVSEWVENIAYELEDMSDTETREYLGITVYCDYINKGNEFTTDWEKMYDFFVLSKEKFLETYSYLTEDDYNATMEIVNNSGTSFAARKCTPISNIIDAIASHSSK